VLFIETPYFTRFCEEHCTDEERQALQQGLLDRPEAGRLIRGTRGLRKLRWVQTKLLVQWVNEVIEDE